MLEIQNLKLDNKALRRDLADSIKNATWHRYARAAFKRTIVALFDARYVQRVCLDADMTHKDEEFTENEQVLRCFVRAGMPSHVSKLLNFPRFVNNVGVFHDL